MGKVFNMVGGGGARSPDLPIGSRINVTSDIGATIDITKGSLHYQKVVTSPHSLPSGYTELDCVVTPDNNTTTYMVLTDVLVNAGYTVEVKFELTRFNTIQTYSCIAGRNSNLQFAISGSGYIGNGNMSYSSTYKVNLNEPFTIKGKFAPSGDNYIYLNGTKTDISRASNDSNTLCLFYHGNPASEQNCFATGKCYWVKVYNNSNVLVKEMIPCRNSSDVVGFYDIVNNVFMPPTGGAFTGEEISQGTVTFTVNYSGTWTIKANKTGETELTETVSILADDTDYDKSMFWRTYLYKDGTEYYPFAQTINAVENRGTCTITKNASDISVVCTETYSVPIYKYLSTQIDLTPYSTLKMKIKNTASISSQYSRILVVNDSSYLPTTGTAYEQADRAVNSMIAYTESGSGIYEFSIDVSNINQTLFVSIGNGTYTSDYSASFNITEVWLE